MSTVPEPDPARRAPGQWRSLLRAVHPRQALALAVAVGALVALMGRPVREVGVSAAAVLLAQLLMGLVNDLADVEADRRSGAPGKPIAEGDLPAATPASLPRCCCSWSSRCRCRTASSPGCSCWPRLLVGVVHNRLLHRTALSWVGWAATFVLLGCFVTYGGWGREADGSAPLTSFLVLLRRCWAYSCTS